jgi:hypothetical protein
MISTSWGLWVKLPTPLTTFRCNCLVGLKVKVSKCKLWSPSRIFPGIEILHDFTLVTNGRNGFLRLCHTFFEWGFILGCGTYWWFFSFGKCPSCFGHSIFMCNSLTFLFHMDNTSFFLIVSFGKFRQKNYASMCPHYRSKIMGVFLGPLSKASSSTIDIL